MAVGNPARVIGTIGQYTEKTMRLGADEENILLGIRCSEMTQEQRKELNDRLKDRCIYYVK